MIQVYSRQDMERGVIFRYQEKNPDHRVAIISITDPDAKPANIVCKLNDYTHVMKLQFHDVDPEIEEKTFGHYTAMTPVQAQQIVEFWQRHMSVELLAVNCEAGISRSAAVAAACAKIAGWPNEHFFRAPYVPNVYVYNETLKAAETT